MGSKIANGLPWQLKDHEIGSITRNEKKNAFPHPLICPGFVQDRLNHSKAKEGYHKESMSCC